MTGPWVGAEMLHQGAEAVVHAGRWMGREAVLKQRQPRTWRHPDLDARLTKSRMSAEVRLLRRLHLAAVPVPVLLAIDATAGWIITSRMPGGPLFDHLRNGGDSDMLEELGATIRRIHATGISHGDLTTHNILWDDEHGLSIIDFGLSQITDDIEPLGLDLQVLNECLKASHPNIEGAIDRVLAGYLGEGGKDVVTRFNDIRGRVRYHG
ncbi:MAG: KEOPS complex kinase/ATPase Bud32 [Candidatus Thalassarchaeaceae archaeon]|jgi:Kae1-associated kinase Bud32|nr:KEOPS complex kinase/ATPase Bud32 [Candidatus Thalassarchaeaceae archaeon]